MDAPDNYLTVKESSEIELKIKGSKFFGRVFPCPDESTAESTLADIRKKFYDATHNCFAWKVGPGNDVVFRYSDDGEPSGTAGRPIYDQIEGKELTNVLIIVTRYFGGTKLGTGGLTRAYGDAADAAIEKAGIIREYITESFDAVVQFSDYNLVERMIHQAGARIDDSDFSDVIRLKIEIRRSRTDELKSSLIETTSGRIEFA